MNISVRDVFLTPSSSGLLIDTIAVEMSDSWETSGGIIVKQSFSCLVKPEVGDSVLISSQSEEKYVVAILVRRSGMQAVVSPANECGLTIKASCITLVSSNDMSFFSKRNICVGAPLGELMIQASSIVQTVSNTVVNIAKEILIRVGYYDLESDTAIMSKASVQIITAEKDIRMDAERINLG
mgnify:CR=1 FL=1